MVFGQLSYLINQKPLKVCKVLKINFELGQNKYFDYYKVVDPDKVSYYLFVGPFIQNRVCAELFYLYKSKKDSL